MYVLFRSGLICLLFVSFPPVCGYEPNLKTISPLKAVCRYQIVKDQGFAGCVQAGRQLGGV